MGLLVDLAIAASTEERYPEVFPHVAMSSSRVLVHNPTVGEEGYLLLLVGVIGDGNRVQTLGLVEFVDPLREDHHNKRAILVLVQERLEP